MTWRPQRRSGGGLARAAWLQGAVTILLLVAALFPARPVFAAACCVSATSGGVGRLLIWEQWAAGLIFAGSQGPGAWDSEGRWRPYRGYGESELRADLWAQVRVDSRSSLYLRAPWLFSWRESATEQAFGQGLGDLQLGGRYELVAIGEYLELPGVALSAAVNAPTGRTPDAAEAPLAADATTRGGWSLGAELVLEQTWLPAFLQARIGASLPLEAQLVGSDRAQRFGPGASLALVAGAELVPDVWILSARVGGSWESAIVLDGAAVSGSERLDLSASVAAAWRFDPHWTLQLSAHSGLFLDGLGDNQPGRWGGQLGLRYGHF